eukprot:2729093-Amphidinium_carterae.1
MEGCAESLSSGPVSAQDGKRGRILLQHLRSPKTYQNPQNPKELKMGKSGEKWVFGPSPTALSPENPAEWGAREGTGPQFL